MIVSLDSLIKAISLDLLRTASLLPSDGRRSTAERK